MSGPYRPTGSHAQSAASKGPSSTVLLLAVLLSTTTYGLFDFSAARADHRTESGQPASNAAAVPVGTTTTEVSTASGGVQGIGTVPRAPSATATRTEAPRPIPGLLGTASAPRYLVTPNTRSAPESRTSPSDFPAQNESGSGNGWAPSDMGLAVSSTYIVQTVNSSLTVYTHSLTPTLLTHSSLNALVSPLHGGTCIDPTATYWGWDGRFAFGCETVSGSSPEIDVVISKTNNPTTNWCSVRLSPSEFLDQQSFTVTADKIVLGGQGAHGYQWWSLNKSQFLSCGFVTYQQFSSTHGPFRAAFHITNEFDAKFVSISGSNIWLANFAGSPGSVGLTVTSIGTASYTIFPDVTIPGGKLGAGKIDNRPLFAVQELESVDNHYVLDFVAHCSSLSVCIYRIDFTGSGNRIANTWIDFYTGYDLTMPSITLDAYGHVFVSYSFSGSSFTPEAVEDAYPPTGGSRYFSTVIWGNVSGTTACGGGTCDESWGDYQAAAQDPSNPSYVWVASQFQSGNGEYGWGTVIAQADYTHVH
jgi:hypothetical protein